MHFSINSTLEYLILKFLYISLHFQKKLLLIFCQLLKTGFICCQKQSYSVLIILPFNDTILVMDIIEYLRSIFWLIHLLFKNCLETEHSNCIWSLTLTKLCDPNESEGPETARPRLSRIASRYLKREVRDNDFKSVSSVRFNCWIFLIK